jgi:nucleoside 2-deoxyribosyltransferase
MKIIVCGSIGYGGLEDIRNIQKLLTENDFEVIDHIAIDGQDYTQVEDFRDKPEIVKKIVEYDLEYLKQSDVIVVVLNKPSIGTSIEMVYARETGKKVFLLAKDKVPTPWPIYFSDYLVRDEKELLENLKAFQNSL